MVKQVVDFINQLFRKLPAWMIYSAAMLPAPVLFYLALQGKLGVDPVKALEHRYGLLGLQFLMATLSVTPLRRLIGLNLMRFRRALGLVTFFYITCHLLIWLVLDVQNFGHVVQDILKRPYISIGMGAFMLMVPLAVTSNKASIRRLGARWRKLHQLTYLVIVLGAVHFIWLSKGWQLEPMLYGVFAAILLFARVRLSGLLGRVRAAID